MTGSLACLERLLASGMEVVGASSLPYDPNGVRYPAWVHLPFLTDPGFDDALDRAVAEHGVAAIFTPHPIVWDHLRARAESGRLGAVLLNPSPATSEAEPYRRALADCRLAPLPLGLAGERPPLGAIETAALLYHADRIAGMCDRDKTRALIEIFRHMPAGDVVEIGSWWGRSALLLLRLSQLHGVGPLLCIDPWASEHLVQGDSSGLVDRHVATIDADEAHRIFTINLLPYARGDANYLRMPAGEALAQLSRRPEVSSPEFGTVAYDGAIAVLHVDGNHAYDNAKADLVGWSGRVASGGWIVVDDYVWPWGDGPRRAGDEFLADHDSSIACAFVMGTALFIRLGETL